jgi:hypothetical protein
VVLGSADARALLYVEVRCRGVVVSVSREVDVEVL